MQERRSMKHARLRDKREETRGREGSSESIPKEALRSNSRKAKPRNSKPTWREKSEIFTHLWPKLAKTFN